MTLLTIWLERIALQAPISPEIVERLLDAQLSEIVGAAVIMALLLLGVFAAIFWRQQGIQRRQQELTEKLSEKFYGQHDTLVRQERILEQQTTLLSAMNGRLETMNGELKTANTTNAKRIEQNDATAKNIVLLNGAFVKLNEALTQSGVLNMSQVMKQVNESDEQKWQRTFERLDSIEQKMDALIARFAEGTPPTPDPPPEPPADDDDTVRLAPVTPPPDAPNADDDGDN